jgi:GT2 family glycosyltransferase
METSIPLVISVIIYSGGRENIIKCLESLRHDPYSNHRIIILDYILSDGLPKLVRETYPDILVV